MRGTLDKEHWYHRAWQRNGGGWQALTSLELSGATVGAHLHVRGEAVLGFSQ